MYRTCLRLNFLLRCCPLFPSTPPVRRPASAIAILPPCANTAASSGLWKKRKRTFPYCVFEILKLYLEHVSNLIQHIFDDYLTRNRLQDGVEIHGEGFWSAIRDDPKYDGIVSNVLQIGCICNCLTITFLLIATNSLITAQTWTWRTSGATWSRKVTVRLPVPVMKLMIIMNNNKQVSANPSGIGVTAALNDKCLFCLWSSSTIVVIVYKLIKITFELKKQDF